MSLLSNQVSDFRFVEDFAGIDPFQWFRIMPVGKFSKFGRFVEITDTTIRDMVNNFRVVPPTRLPVNLEHEDTAGKVGDIASLRAVPGDGLYAIIDWTAEGERMLREQRFQYYSPEIIFGPTDYEGKMVKNILYGLALTNHPYFGTDTALYTLKGGEFVDFGASGATSDPLEHSLEIEGDIQMDEAKVVEGVWQRFTALFNAAPTATPTPAPATPVQPTVSLEAFNALKEENERIKLEKAEAERVAKEAAFSNRVAGFAATLGESMAPLAEKLALIEDDALANDLAEQFKALAAQADAGELFSEFGTSGGDPDANLDGAARFNAMVDRKVKDGMSEVEALRSVTREHPDLYEAYRRASINKTKEG